MSTNRRQTGSIICANLLCASLAAFTATAQVPKVESDPADTAVALTSTTCPTVSPHSLISLDWNPGFEHESVVTGIDRFGLVFAPVAADGVTVITHPNHEYSGSLARSVSATPTTNGYYHLEFRLSAVLRPGLYRVVDAAVAPHLQPEYSGPVPGMTVSPARDRLCITVMEAPQRSNIPMETPSVP